VSLLKALGSSVSLLSILAVWVLIGMALFVWPRTRRFARRWLLFVTGVYLVFGLPVVANAIVSALPDVKPRPPTAPVRLLVVLDGDNRRGRLNEVIRVLETDRPDIAWILGEVWFLDELEAAGFPRGRFHHETATSNTREQMAWVAEFAARHPGIETTLVASVLQVPRILELSQSAGLGIALVASPLDEEPAAGGWRAWLPSFVALRTSRDAIYEHVALWYYRWHGWIGA